MRRISGEGTREKINVGEPIKEARVRESWMRSAVWEANGSSSLRECHMLP